MANSKFV